MGRFSKLVGTRGQRGKRNARKKCKDSDQQGNKNANSKDGSRGPAGRTVHAAVACSKSIQKKGGEKKKGGRTGRHYVAQRLYYEEQLRAADMGNSLQIKEG